MNIIAFNGSPNTARGMTHTMVQEFLRGAREAGAEVETIFLEQQNIRHCRGCMNCWVRTPGKCILQDDMHELSEKYLGADVTIFATPLYIDNVSGLMKTFMDRLYMPIVQPGYEKDPEFHECRHLRNHEILPRMVVLSAGGNPEQSNFQVLRLLFRRIARNFDLELAAEIYRGGGSIMLRDGSGMESLAEQYKELLRKAGREFVQKSELSGETKALLEQAVMPGADYVDRYIGISEEMFAAWIAAAQA